MFSLPVERNRFFLKSLAWIPRGRKVLFLYGVLVSWKKHVFYFFGVHLYGLLASGEKAIDISSIFVINSFFLPDYIIIWLTCSLGQTGRKAWLSAKLRKGNSGLTEIPMEPLEGHKIRWNLLLLLFLLSSCYGDTKSHWRSPRSGEILFSSFRFLVLVLLMMLRMMSDEDTYGAAGGTQDQMKFVVDVDSLNCCFWWCCWFLTFTSWGLKRIGPIDLEVRDLISKVWDEFPVWISSNWELNWNWFVGFSFSQIERLK